VKKTDILVELRALDAKDLVARREAMEREALAQRLLLGTAMEKNFRIVRETRRNIARLNTVLKEKENLQKRLKAEAGNAEKAGTADAAAELPGGEG
jgi:ribosomal protein L29